MRTITTTLTDGTPAKIAREAGKGGDAIVIREAMSGPAGWAATVVAAIYVQHVTTAVLRSVGVHSDDMASVIAMSY